MRQNCRSNHQKNAEKDQLSAVHIQYLIQFRKILCQNNIFLFSVIEDRNPDFIRYQL